MDLTHRFTVPASVDETWRAFNHLDRLAPCFPGATIANSDGDDFEGSIKIKIGPLALFYNGSGRFLERDAEAHRLVFEASGDDRRGNGSATARVTASLVGNGSGTEVELTTDLDFSGRPAQFGSGVVSDVSDKLLRPVRQLCLRPLRRWARGAGRRGRGRRGCAGDRGRRAVGGMGRRRGAGGRATSERRRADRRDGGGRPGGRRTDPADERSVAGRGRGGRRGSGANAAAGPLPRRPTATARPATSPRPTPTWWPTWWAPCSGGMARCSGSCPWRW